MSHVVVSVDLLEAAVLVAEVAPLAVRTVPLAVELPAILGLIFVVNALLLLVEVLRVVLRELLDSMCVLALVAVSTKAGVGPVLAHFSLVHGALHKRFHVSGVQLDLLQLRAIVVIAGDTRMLF